MDEIKTGVFEISTTWNDFWKDWQLELAKEDLRRRARAAMDKIMREGVPYVTCLYPPIERDGNLVLSGFCALALWEDCEPYEAVFLDWDSLDLEWIQKEYDRKFALENKIRIRGDQIYIYRRVQ